LPTDSNGNVITTAIATEGPDDNEATATFGVITDGSTTITFGVDPTQTGIACSVDAECILDTELCVIAGINVCICDNSVCVVDPDLTPGGPTTGPGGPDPTDDFPPAPTETLACATDDDCLALGNACLFNGENICSCVDGVCVQGPIPGGPEGSGSVGPTDGPELTTLTGTDGEPTTTVTMTSDGPDDPELTTLDGPDGEPTATITLTDGPELTTLDGPDGEPTATVTLTGDDPDGPELTTLDGPDGEPTATFTLTDDITTDPEVTTLDGPDGEPTATLTLTATDPAETEFPCTTDADCLADLGLCVDGPNNLCICVNAICIVDPVTNVETTATDDIPAPTPTTGCTTADDCVANTELCLDGPLNICICLDAVCVVAPDAAATTSGVVPTETATIECSTDDDCLINVDLCLTEGPNFCVCVDAVCVVPGGNGGTGDSCTGDSDCTTPGDVCTNSVCAPTGGGACVDGNDCLLSSNPLCALGLCVCVDAVCQINPNVEECSGNGDCSPGATCENGVCVDEIECSDADDCLENLDLCVLPGVCACVNGVCGLVGNGPTPECTAFEDCRALPRCQLELCLCDDGQCVFPG